MLGSLKLSLLSIGAAGLLAAGALLAVSLHCFGVLDRSAREAMVAKDVVADILPPPLYLIESRLILSQAVEGTLPIAEALTLFERLRHDYDERIAYWRNDPPGGLAPMLLGEQHTSAEAFAELARRDVLGRLEVGDRAGAQAGLREAQALYMTHRAAIDHTVKAGSTLASTSIDRFAASQTQGIWTLWSVAAALVAAVCACFLMARRDIVGPIGRCTALAQQVASGKLGASLSTRRRDELGQLEAALSAMSQNLATMVAGVRASVEQIAVASAQISEGNSELSTRTEQQAGRLQETASSMEQMDQAVRENAGSARAANNLAVEATSVARTGGQAVGQVMSTMSEIRNDSSRISDITAVIDAIAFQTNILALNAAVEAARAGDRGRGFAVVAGEVRTLASKCKDAAGEIRGLLKANVEKVGAGSEQAGNAERTMAAVVRSVQDVEGLVHQISTSSEQQSQGVGLVNAAVSSLEVSTQQNAALVEEIAAAAQSLRDQAFKLSESVQSFKLEGEWTVGVA